MSGFAGLLTMFACILALCPATLAQTEQCDYSLFYYGQPAGMTPSGLNNSDTLVGTYFDCENRARGFIRFQDGLVMSYEVPNLPASQWVFLKGINDKSQIVGYVSVKQESGFVVTAKNLVPIVFPDAYWTAPSSINNKGEIVGSYIRGNESSRGFLYESGRFTSLSVPGSLVTEASGINDAGVIVGTFSDNESVNHGFVRMGSRYRTLDFPGASWTMLTGINNRGEIVGIYSMPPGPVLGFVYKDGQFENVSVSNMDSAQVLAIDDHGDLAGLTFTADYNGRGFVGTNCR